MSRNVKNGFLFVGMILTLGYLLLPLLLGEAGLGGVALLYAVTTSAVIIWNIFAGPATPARPLRQLFIFAVPLIAFVWLAYDVILLEAASGPLANGALAALGLIIFIQFWPSRGADPYIR